jgi:structural maintenance of chromosomes protein 5
VDNMCQFLPQERIGEFSRMDKVKLLAESIKAIGSGDLYETHVEIVKMDEENSTLEQARLLSSSWRVALDC